MKKLLLSLCCIVAAIFSISAADNTFDFATLYGSTTIDASTQPQTVGNVTVSFAKGNSNTNPAYNKAGEIRLYGGKSETVLDGNQMTYATTDGAAITKIVLNPGSSCTWGTLTADAGELTVADDHTATWTGSASTVTFTLSRNADATATSTQFRIKTAVVTAEGEVDPNAIATPVITPNGGQFIKGEVAKISISCATEGASIQYSINGGNAIEYTEPFAINGDSEIMAIAMVGDYESTPATANFTFVDGTVYKYVQATAITPGKAYIMVANGYAATPLSSNYGYLQTIDAIDIDSDGIIYLSSEANEFTINSVDGGYNILDKSGYYYYQTGTYNSFNRADATTDGDVWTIEAQADGSFKILNASVNKFIQYDTQYGSYGSYEDARGVMPFLFERVTEEDPGTGEEPVESLTVADVIAGATGTEVWVTGYIVGFLNSSIDKPVFGTESAVATNILLADAAEESAVANCIPVQLPSGDVRSAINLKDNPTNLGRQVMLKGNLEKYFTVPGLKSVTEYKFLSDAGTTPEPPVTTSYEYKKVTSITDGKAYIIVAEGKLATPLTSNYGYLQVTDVTDVNGVITLTSDANEFTIKAATNGYNIVDKTGYYYYQTGTFNSFNRATASTDGDVWTIEAQADGTFKILNASVNKFIQYDTTYSSYGSYEDARGVMPSLYERVGDDNQEPVVPTTKEVENLKAYYDLAVSDLVKFKNPLTVVYQNGINLVVTDESGYFALVYGSLTQTYANGDVIPAGVEGSVGTYNGLYQLIPTADSFAAATAGEEVAPTEIEVTGLASLEPYAHHYIKISNVSFTLDTDKTRNYTISDGTNTIAGYDSYKVNVDADGAVVTTPDATKKYDIIGIAAQYKSADNKQVSIISFDETSGVEGVAAATVSVYAIEGGVAVNGVDSKVVVFNVFGQKVAEADVNGNTAINTPSGIMIVKAGNLVAKVLVK